MFQAKSSELRLPTRWLGAAVPGRAGLGAGGTEEGEAGEVCALGSSCAGVRGGDAEGASKKVNQRRLKRWEAAQKEETSGVKTLGRVVGAVF